MAALAAFWPPSMIQALPLAGVVLLGALPFWSDGERRLSLDRIPVTALFLVCSPEEAYLFSVPALFVSIQMYGLLHGRRIDQRKAVIESFVSPSMAFALSSAFDGSGFLWFTAVYLSAHTGDMLARALSLRLPTTILRARPCLVSFVLSLPFALLVCRGVEKGSIPLVILLLATAAAFSLLAKTRLDAQATYMRLASETAIQNNLAAELSTASSVGQYLGLLEAYLRSSTGGIVILSRQESGQGWIGWMEDRQHAVTDAEMPLDPVPDPGVMVDEYRFNGVDGSLMGLSRSPDMLVFAPGEAGGTLVSMDAMVRRNLVSLVTHSWRAVGHSMAIEEAFIAAAMILARLADSKDDYTHGHSVRVSRLSQKIGREMELSAEMLRTLMVGALLHDLGKVAIPVEILTKRGLLTREERDVIERHPVEGTRILGTLSGYDMVRSIVQSHHERLDGKGYPSGLSGRDIPFPARIVAVADTFDAITSRRSYRENSDVRTAVDAINAGAGTQFDSRIVSALIRVLERGDLLEGSRA